MRTNILHQVEVSNRDGVTIFRNDHRDGGRSFYVAPWDIDGIGRTVVGTATSLNQRTPTGPINCRSGSPPWVKAQAAWTQYISTR